MRVPESCVLMHDGEVVPLYSLAKGKRVALVFLRHLGCIFCREQVATLRDTMPEANIVFVTMAGPRLAARFRTWIRSPHPFVCDADRELYHAFGLERGSFAQVFAPNVAARGLAALRKGHRPGRLTEDPWQLGGSFVMDDQGCVSASFPASDAGDHPSPEALKRALTSP
ncbi:redoxin domain-containing protein [bacterium]|nr:MAG: redoxin domain-containing protein [bacterium]